MNATTKPLKPLSPEQIRQLRLSLGMNQTQFWSQLGVTQSGGSRYESGRNVPDPIRLLLELVYGRRDRAEKLFARLRRDAQKDGKTG